ncbi:MAG TPA: 4-hydroxy-tetrahydrodipicolinate reductase [Steroidobacteraceae bacterium]|nr:4-hydroxy-tetrahydrodipicolinate reductase [Steroidobacteraceae bacterium]
MTTRVCIAGVTGHIGKPLAIAVSKADDLCLVGAVCRAGKGRSAAAVTGDSAIDVPISGSVAEALKTPTDVYVDYTSAEAVKGNVLAAIEHGVHIVIGTSGLTDDDYAAIDSAARARKVGVLAAGNFSITAVLLQRFACEAAKYISQWEIIDYAYDRKRDSPSGTARELSFRMGQVRHPQYVHPVEKTVGPQEARGASMNGIRMHSIRLPGFYSSIEAIFGAKNERLSIRQDAAEGHEPYIQGTLLAIRKVRDRVGLVRGLDRVTDLPGAPGC